MWFNPIRTEKKRANQTARNSPIIKDEKTDLGKEWIKNIIEGWNQNQDHDRIQKLDLVG